VYANTDDARKTHSIASIVAFYFPIVQWIQSYRFGSGTRIIRDVVSAINLALMYLPQGIGTSHEPSSNERHVMSRWLDAMLIRS